MKNTSGNKPPDHISNVTNSVSKTNRITEPEMTSNLSLDNVYPALLKTCYEPTHNILR